jgi:hypothetical protein
VSTGTADVGGDGVFSRLRSLVPASELRKNSMNDVFPEFWAPITRML